MAESYSAPLRALHWLMAAIIFVAIGLGVWATFLPRGTHPRVEILDIHKSLGLTALALVGLRAIVRLASRAPPYRPPLGRLNHIAASAAHGLLYVVMVALPVSGYVHSMAGRHEFAWFGLFAVPNLVPLNPKTDASAAEVHYVFALAIGALLTAHVLAALWHGFVRRDGVLARMWPA
jgi:cytochrome b561